MRIGWAVLIGGLVCATVGCENEPPPALAHADTSISGLRVHILPTIDFLGAGVDEEKDEESRKAMLAAQQAIVVRMTEAGYKVVGDKGPWDLSTVTWFTTKRPPHEDLAFARVRLRLKDRKGATVDEITVEFKAHHAPATEPDRVALALVNEMTHSLKVATFAAGRKKAPPKDEPATPPPAASSAPAPATPAPPTP